MCKEDLQQICVDIIAKRKGIRQFEAFLICYLKWKELIVAVQNAVKPGEKNGRRNKRIRNKQSKT